MDERELYNKYHRSDNIVSTTISTIVVQGGPLQLVIALLRVRISDFFFVSVLWSVSSPLEGIKFSKIVSVLTAFTLFDTNYRLLLRVVCK